MKLKITAVSRLAAIFGILGVLALSGCKWSGVTLEQSDSPVSAPNTASSPSATSTPGATSTPRPQASSTPKPTQTPSPSPSPVSSPNPSPSAATWSIDFNPSTSGPLAAAKKSVWVPHPWYADYCGQDSLGLDASGRAFRFTVRDGCNWATLDGKTVYNYARAEIALVGGTVAFPADRETKIEWRGYFKNPLPSYVSGGQYFIAPFQIHNKNNVSPMYAMSVDIKSRKLVLVEHSLTGKFVAAHPIADYEAFLNQSRSITLRILTTNQARGRVSVEVDGQRVYFKDQIATSSTPGQDYIKFGIYDWANIVVSPGLASRGRVFELITEKFRVSY